MFFNNIKLKSYNHKLTKKQIVSIADYMKAMDYAHITIVKQENGEYTYSMEIGNKAASSVCLELSYEEVVNILNNIREMDDCEKIQITQTPGPIGITTKITTNKIDNVDVTDYSCW